MDSSLVFISCNITCFFLTSFQCSFLCRWRLVLHQHTGWVQWSHIRLGEPTPPGSEVFLAVSSCHCGDWRRHNSCQGVGNTTAYVGIHCHWSVIRRAGVDGYQGWRWLGGPDSTHQALCYMVRVHNCTSHLYRQDQTRPDLIWPYNWYLCIICTPDVHIMFYQTV